LKAGVGKIEGGQRPDIVVETGVGVCIHAVAEIGSTFGERVKHAF